MSRHLITVAEAAERTGVSRAAIHDRIKRGRLTKYQLVPNGRVWLDPDELDRMYHPSVEDLVASAPPPTPEQAEQIRRLMASRGGAA